MAIMIKKVTLELKSTESFRSRIDYTPRYHNLWHYHEEVEYIHIERGRGTFYIGDCVRNFKEGDIVIIGSNIPHYWLFDQDLMHAHEESKIDVKVIHFNPQIFGKDFLKLPENQPIKQLLQHTHRALHLKNCCTDQLQAITNKIIFGVPTERLLYLLHLLNFSANYEAETLTSDQYAMLNRPYEQERLNNIIEYLRVNFKHNITLSKISEVSGLTSNSFCRYFKTNTGKTFVEFLTEMRVQYACKLLSDTDMTIKQICYDSGFNNFVSFHKKFKQYTGTTPSLYQKSNRFNF